MKNLTDKIDVITRKRRNENTLTVNFNIRAKP